jgi:hypothetical protein
MKNQGFVIVRDKLANKFFTTTSSYDRPQWVPLEEATVFLSPDMANTAAKKLWKNGAYSAKLIPLEELMVDKEEDLQPSDVTTDDDPTLDELPAKAAYGGEEGDDITAMDVPPGDEPSAYDGEGGDDVDAMCGCGDPECQDPECEGRADDADAASAYDGEEGDDIPAMDTPPGDDVELDSVDGDVSMSFELPDEEGVPKKRPAMESVTLDETGLSTGTLRAYIKKASKTVKDMVDAGDMINSVKRGKKVVFAASKVMDKEGTKNNVNESVASLGVKDPVDTSKKDLLGVAKDHGDKISVPADIKSSLKAVIADFRKQAGDNAEAEAARNDNHASFCLTAADALQQLLDDLSLGTSEGMKKAQIHMTSYMSPITQHIPAEVVKFIARGGQKSTLKDLFSSVKESKRISYDAMADQYVNKD